MWFDVVKVSNPLIQKVRNMSIIEPKFRTPLHGYFLGLAKKNSTTDFGDPKKFFGDETDNQYDLEFVTANLTDEQDNSNAFWFTRELLVVKHQTARLKPFNLQHNAKEIIGVIYDSAVVETVDDKFNRILIVGEDIKIDSETGELKFDESIKGKVSAYVACALYNMVAPDEVADIVAKVEKGEKVPVSMECWYQKWDYIFKDIATGGHSLVKRRKETAYLDEMVGKVIDGKKICKIPESAGFIFGGIGQVDKGACPNSVILAVARDLHSENVIGDSAFTDNGIKLLQEAATANKSDDKTQDTNSSKGEETPMSDTTTATKPAETTQQPPAAASAGQGGDTTRQDVVTALATASTQLGQANVKIDGLNTTVEELKKAQAELKADLDKQIETLKGEKATLETKVAELAKANKGFANLVYLLENEKELQFTSLSEIATKLQDMDEAQVKEFAAKKKEDEKKALEEKKKVEKAAKIEALGLEANATDEDIEKATAALKAGRGSAPPPSAHRVGAPAKDETTQTETASDKGNAQKETAKLKIIDNDTGKVTEL